MPQMGRTIGRAIRQFRNAQEEMNKVVRQEVYDPDGDHEPLNDTISGIFKEFTGEKKEPAQKAVEKLENSAAPEAKQAKSASASTSASQSSSTSEDAPLDTSTVKKKEIQGETFAQKKARLAREKAEKEALSKGKGEDEASVADKLYGITKEKKSREGDENSL